MGDGIFGHWAGIARPYAAFQGWAGQIGIGRWGHAKRAMHIRGAKRQMRWQQRRQETVD